MPIIGADGVSGCVIIVAVVAEAADVHPEALVTVKVYVPAANPLKVVVNPVPVVVNPPGVVVIVQVPVAGNPVKATLPVAKAHVGGVIVPTIGAVGFEFTVMATDF